MNASNAHDAKSILTRAMEDGYGVGAFSCRYPVMIPAVLAAAQAERSPVILQISQIELVWLGLEPDGFFEEVRRSAGELGITIPFAVHLDHGWELDVVEQAVKAGFSSVMLDSSSRTLHRNIEATRDVVEMAHVDGVAVEAELGHVDGARRPEEGGDDVLYTEAAAAEIFVRETKCDFLAVSVGTSHGVHRVRVPRVDFSLVEELSRVTAIPLVLHDTAGVDASAIARAVSLPGGGICKITIDAELEMAVLQTLGLDDRLTMEEALDLSPLDRGRVHAAVMERARGKMRSPLGSSGKA